MKKIDITARFEMDGTLQPIEFSAEGRAVKVQNVGRQWETADGKHVLVMDLRGRTYHLFLQLNDLSWYWIKDIKPGPNAA